MKKSYIGLVGLVLVATVFFSGCIDQPEPPTNGMYRRDYWECDIRYRDLGGRCQPECGENKKQMVFPQICLPFSVRNV